MNRSFRKIWNKVRGQVVCVAETATAHSQSGCTATVREGACVDTVGSTASFTRSLVSLSVAGLFAVGMTGFAQAADIDPSTWAAGADATMNVTGERNAMGATYGKIGPEWIGSWDTTQKTVVTINAAAGLKTGVWFAEEDEFLGPLGDMGGLGQTGLLRHWAVVNNGYLVDNQTISGRTDGKTSSGNSVNWINKFHNKGTVNVFDLRALEVLNESANFTLTGALHLQDGGRLENKAGGVMNIDELRAGVLDGTAKIFTSNTTVDDGTKYILPDVTYGDGSTTSIANAGDMTVGHATVAGSVLNTGTMAFTKTGDANTFGATENSGTMTFAADAEFGSLNLSAAAAKLLGGVNVTSTGALVNKGTIGEDATKLLTLTSDSTDNTGTIYVAGLFTSTNATLNKGTVTAGKLTAGAVTNGDATNAGVLTLTDAGATSTMASLTQTGAASKTDVRGSLTLAAASTVAGQITVDKTLDATGLFTNAGTAVIGQLATEAVTNTGTMTAGGFGDSDVAGAFSNAGTAALTLAGKLTADTLTNEANAKIDGAQDLVIDTAAGTVFTNAGKIGETTALNSITVAGRASNDGLLKTADASLAGALANTGTINASNALAVTGAVTNEGAITAKTADLDAKLTNTGASSSVKVEEQLDVGLATMNEGTIEAGWVNLAGVTNEAGATMTLKGTTASNIGALVNKGDVNLNGAAGDVTNSVTIASVDNQAAGTIDGSDINVTGTITNANTMVATGKLAAGALTTNNKNITAAQLALADVTNNAGATLLVNGTNDSSVGALVNKGTVDLAGTGRTLTNKVTAASIDNQTETSVLRGSTVVSAGNVNNAGAITVGTADFGAGFTNTKTFSAVDSTALLNKLGAVSNTGDITVAADAKLSSLSQTDWAAAFNVSASGINIEVTGDVHNEGSITAADGDPAAAKLTVGGNMTSDGGYAAAEEMGVTGNLTSSASLIDTKDLTVTGTTTVTSGTIQAADMALKDVVIGNDGQLIAATEIGTGHFDTGTPTVEGTSAAVAENMTLKGGLFQTGAHGANLVSIATEAKTGTNANKVDLKGDLAVSGNVSFTQADDAMVVETDGIDIAVTGGLTNAGKIGANVTDGQPAAANVNVTGDTQNTGTITAQAASFSTMTNSGNIKSTGLVQASGTAGNSGLIDASKLAMAAVNNQAGGVINASAVAGQTVASTFGDVENAGTMALRHNTTMGGLTNTAGSVFVTDDGTEAGTAVGTLTLDSMSASGTAKLVAKDVTVAQNAASTVGTITAEKLDVTGNFSQSGDTTTSTTSSLLKVAGTTTIETGALVQADNQFQLGDVAIKSGATLMQGDDMDATTLASTAKNVTLAGGVIRTGTGGLTVDSVTTEADAVASAVNRVTITDGSMNVTGDFKFTQTTDKLVAEKLDAAALPSLTVAGALTNAGLMATDTERLSALAVTGETTNTGSIYAKTATLGALSNTTAAAAVKVTEALTVGGLLTNGADAVIEAKTVAINGDTAVEDNTNAGSITATDGVKATKNFTNTGSLVTGTGLTVENGAVATLRGTVTGTDLKLTAAKAVIDSANVALTNLKATGASTLENTQDVEFDNVQVEDGFTYRQTAGSFKTSDNSFFQNSTLSIEGGKLERLADGFATLGTGNTVTISGQTPGSYTDKTQKPDFAAGQTYVHVGELNSASTVTVDAGGVLEADKVNLTQTGKFTLSGGALAAKLSNLFQTVAESSVKITDGTQVNLETTVIGASNVGDLKTEFKDNLTIDGDGGTLVITDDAVSLTAIATASQKLQAIGGTAVVYTGIASSGDEGSTEFYHNTFTALKNEQALLGSSFFRDPGVVFTSMAYNNKADMGSTAKTKLVVGNEGMDGDTFYVDASIGFRNILGTKDVTVQDGYTFALTGDAVETELVDAADGALKVTGANTMMKLGSAAVPSAKGHIGSLTLDGDNGESTATKLSTVAGEYRVTNFNFLKGLADVAATAKLTIENLADNAAAKLENLGTVVVQTASAINSAIENSGSFTVESDTTLNTAFKNLAGVSEFEKLSLNAGLSNEYGAKVVTNGGFEVDSALIHRDVSTQGRLVSYGDNLVKGILTIDKAATTKGQMVAQGATSVQQGRVNVLGEALFGSVNVQSGIFAAGADSLVYVEDLAGLNVDADSTFYALNGSKIGTTTLQLNGINRIFSNAQFFIGAAGMQTLNVTELKGSDYRDTLMTNYLSWGRPAASTFALRSTGRGYDVDETNFVTNMAFGTVTADQWLGGVNDGESVRLGDSTLDGTATLHLSTNVFVLDGSTLTVKPLASISALDWHRADGTTWNTNVIVKGTVDMQGTAEYSNLVTAGSGYYGLSGMESGELLTVLGGTYDVQATGVADWAKATVSDGAEVTIAGNMNADDMTVEGTVSGAGYLMGGTVNVAQTGHVNVANLNVEELRNAGMLTIASASQFGEDNTYVHIGNAVINVTDGTWFDGTNIVYDGGAMIETTDIRDDGTLGSNVVTIKREGFNPVITAGTPNTATFDGMTTVHVAKLTDETTVSVLEGGRLIIDELTGTANAELNGGVLDLAIADLTVVGSTISGIETDAESPADSVEIDSTVATNPDGVRFSGDKLAGWTMTDGTVNLSDAASVNLSVLASVSQGLASMGHVTTVFNGTVNEASGAGFTVETIRDLLAEQGAVEGSQVTDPGVVLTQYALVADDNSTVNFTTDDTAENAIGGSIGFKKVTGADAVNVADGLTVTLTGSALADGDFDWSDANRVIASATDGVGGVATAEADGRFVFGSDGTMQQNTGWVDTVVADGKVEVKNFVLGVADELSVGEEGTVTVASNAGVIAGDVIVDEGGTIVNKGELVADSLVIEGVYRGAEGVTDVTNTYNAGEAYYGDRVLTAGMTNTVAEGGREEGTSLVVETGAEQIVAGGESVWTDLGVAGGTVVMTGGVIEAETLTVEAGSSIHVNAGILAANGMTAEEVKAVTDKPAAIGLAGTLDVTGSTLTVGTVPEDAALDQGDVYFGGDSAIVLDTSRISGTALKGDGKLSVENGSQLVVSNASWGKHILVTDGLDITDVADGAWQGDNLVNRTDKEIAVTKGETGFIVAAGTRPVEPETPVEPEQPVGPTEPDTSIQALSKDFVAPGLINGLIDTDDESVLALRDPNSPFADVAFIERMLDPAYMGKDGKLDVRASVKAMNSVIGLAAATGIDAYAFDMASDRMNRVEDRVTGKLNRTAGELWVELTGRKTKADGLEFGSGDTGYKADTYGFIMGGDLPVTPDFHLGAALNYAKGDVDSEGSFHDVSSDAETFGFSVYGAKGFGALRLSGHAGYDLTKGESKMHFGDIAGNAYKVEGDQKVKGIGLGIRADWTFDLNAFSVTPHMGVRYAHTSYSGFDTKINGKTAFTSKGEATDIVQMPIGVTVSGVIKNGGWAYEPSADFSIIPQFGDTDGKVNVSAANFKGMDSYNREVAGDVVGRMSLGLTAHKNAHSFGISYTGAVGNKGAQSHAVNFTYKFTF